MKPHMSKTSYRKVIELALFSRICLLVLTVLWRTLARPYDTSALLNPPCLAAADFFPHHYDQQLEQPDHRGSVQTWARQILERTIVWDGVYYVRIAECGYEYEQTFAFFPLFPLCIRLLGNTVFVCMVPLLGYRATLAFSGLIINNFTFILAAIFMYRISLIVLHDEHIAFQATALFCGNPASIFYASIYTESLFSLFTFWGLWELLQSSSGTAAMFFGLSSGCRSNGILHGGFLIYSGIQNIYRAIFCYKCWKGAVRNAILIVFQSAVVLCPFVAFQMYGFSKFCTEPEEAETNNGRPWCNAKIPYLYGFIQSHYWDVGFLRYFRLKQLPNFILALPILSLACCSLVAYIREQPMLFFCLGFSANPYDSFWLPSDIQKRDHPKGQHEKSKRGYLRQRKLSVNVSQTDETLKEDETDTLAELTLYKAFYSPTVIPFLLEMAFMALVSLLIMHVQVATRFLSICAPIYWFAASIIHYSPVGYKFGYMIWTIFLSYILLGSLLFVNFYPFT